MYLGIALGIILFVILIIAIVRTDTKNAKPAGLLGNLVGMIWFFALFFGVPSLCCYAQNLPTVDTAKYQITVDANNLTGDHIIFDTYDPVDNNRIYISSHYYLRTSWINYWEYSNSPLTIVVPRINNELDIETRIKTDRGDIQVIYPEQSRLYIEK